MAILFPCCSGRNGSQKKKKDVKESSKADFNKALKTLKIRLEQPVKPVESDEMKASTFSMSVPICIQKDSLNVKVVSRETPVRDEATEVAYEGEDEHEENSSMKRDLSDFDLQARVGHSAEECFSPRSAKLGYSYFYDTKINEHFANNAEKDDKNSTDVIQSGHVSDPGIEKAEIWGSPRLKRSCSNLESSKVPRNLAVGLPPKFWTSREQQELSGKLRDPGSPASVTSHMSADRVILKKHSSSQVLPSGSRKLWWKLFLWSHRNLHKPQVVKPQPQAAIGASNQQAGYTSDTLELNRAIEKNKMQSPGSFTGESLSKGYNNNEDDNQRWDGFPDRASNIWPQNQWVAFSIESSAFARVDEWVKDLDTHPPADISEDKEDNVNEGIVFPPSPDGGRSPERSTAHLTRRPDTNISEEILHANNMIQSLNATSTVAHISGISLKAIPTISHYTSLRTVNLSNNFIVHITPGSLPKGLHTLNLSRNKISTIEGLRELTRLRVLDLSYNRISRIGQGLSNCTIIKEMYLAGNKISDVEGLHRLLKLTVLDLSFNKITTTKALGQLVANYNSLQALNLLGNPIQSNISDDQLRKAVCSLLPKLVYLNKQPIKPQRAREVLTDSVAKAALGTGSSWSSRRRAAKRLSSSGSAPTVHRNISVSGRKGRSRSKSQTQHVKTMPLARASR